MRDDHSSRPVIAHRLQQPTRKLRRAVFFEQRTRHASVLGRFPIWPCSVRGFACHLPYSRRGALLPHLFTLTFRLASPRLAQGRPFDSPRARSHPVCERLKGLALREPRRGESKGGIFSVPL